MTEERRLQRALRERTKYLRLLTRDVKLFIAWMDAEMKKPSTVERGSRIAKVLNALEMSNDCARRFGLPRKVKARSDPLRTSHRTTVRENTKKTLRDGVPGVTQGNKPPQDRTEVIRDAGRTIRAQHL